MNIDSVLVIGEASSDGESLALRKALFLVQDLPITIHLLWVIYSKTDGNAPTLARVAAQPPQDALLQQAAADVATLLQRVCPDAQNVSHEVVWNNSVSDATEAICRNRKFDLVIKTGHRSESMLHVPTDFHLLRIPQVPVMVLRRHAWSARPTVLAAIDYVPRKQARMDFNRKVLASAKRIAEMESAALHCCYVVERSKVLIELDIIEPRDQLTKFVDRHLDELHDFVADYGVAPDQVHVKTGVPAKLIPSTANKIKADLVVIGTHHRRGLRGFLIGNTCEKVLSVLRTAVLTIKPE